MARKFLKWYSFSHGIPIQDCESPLYEKRIGDYRVDGFIRKEDRPLDQQEKDLVLEIHGYFFFLFNSLKIILVRCYYHACPKCYPIDAMMVNGNKSAGLVRQKNDERLQKILDEGYDVEVFWECFIKEELKINDEMNKFFQNTFTAGFNVLTSICNYFYRSYKIERGT